MDRVSEWQRTFLKSFVHLWGELSTLWGDGGLTLFLVSGVDPPSSSRRAVWACAFWQARWRAVFPAWINIIYRLLSKFNFTRGFYWGITREASCVASSITWKCNSCSSHLLMSEFGKTVHSVEWSHYSSCRSKNETSNLKEDFKTFHWKSSLYIFVCFKTSPRVLQSLRRMLQCCLAVKLQRSTLR